LSEDRIRLKINSIHDQDTYTAGEKRHHERCVRPPDYTDGMLPPAQDECFDYRTTLYKKAKCTHRVGDPAECKQSLSNAPSKKDRCLCTCHIKGYEAT